MEGNLTSRFEITVEPDLVESLRLMLDHQPFPNLLEEIEEHLRRQADASLAAGPTHSMDRRRPQGRHADVEVERPDRKGEIFSPVVVFAEDDQPARPLHVAKVGGLIVKIWADEHPPPHFHVDYDGQSASFSIVSCDRLPGVVGLERYERTIKRWWQKNKPLLVEKWNASRPSDCCVGPVDLSAI
jgi:hypothetical protein